MKRLAIAMIAVSVLSGCASNDTQMKPPATQAQSVSDQVTAIQNDPNMPPDAKARVIAQLQRGSQAQPPKPNAHK